MAFRPKYSHLNDFVNEFNDLDDLHFQQCSKFDEILENSHISNDREDLKLKTQTFSLKIPIIEDFIIPRQDAPPQFSHKTCVCNVTTKQYPQRDLTEANCIPSRFFNAHLPRAAVCARTQKVDPRRTVEGISFISSTICVCGIAIQYARIICIAIATSRPPSIRQICD